MSNRLKHLGLKELKIPALPKELMDDLKMIARDSYGTNRAAWLKSKLFVIREEEMRKIKANKI